MKQVDLKPCLSVIIINLLAVSLLKRRTKTNYSQLVQFWNNIRGNSTSNGYE
jgi:hypothetical protein